MTFERTRSSFALTAAFIVGACGAPETNNGGDAGLDGARDAHAGDGSGAFDAVDSHDAQGGEICGNGLDDDHNGLVDDGCPCVPGQTQSCYPGDPMQAGVGACTRGQQQCSGSGEFGSWGACTGAGHPSPETCNGVDDDCNGRVDDGLGSSTCGVGACARTVPNCMNGMHQTCVPGMPMPETCDGVDNDCNGMVDDGLGSTTCGTGACARTVQNCVAGARQTCVPGTPTPEVCDGLDNDCNGMVDDGLGMTTCGMGACARTVANCVGGVPQTCTSGTGSPEVCDGIDNDCNGMIDDGIPSVSCTPTGMPCVTGMTACTSGTTVCNATGMLPAGTPCGSGMVCDSTGVCRTPVNCVGSWSACSVSCGTGTETYTITQPALYGGTSCPYANGATQSCDAGACPPTCTTVNYPIQSWTCPDGVHSQYLIPFACGCASYDSSGNGIDCSNSYFSMPQTCSDGSTGTNQTIDPGSCECHL